MKAADYVDLYNRGNRNEEALASVATKLMLEVNEIAKQRKIHSNARFLSILDEVEKKWKAFVEQAKDPTINPDGFRNFIKNNMPTIHHAWMTHKNIATPR